MLSGFRRLRHQTVVIHLHSGESIQGVLRHSFRDVLVLLHARHLSEGEDLKGEIVIPRDGINFLQVVGG